MAGKPKQYPPIRVIEPDSATHTIATKAIKSIQIQMLKQFFASCTPEEQQAIIAHYQ